MLGFVSAGELLVLELLVMGIVSAGGLLVLGIISVGDY